ncbi:hypothetical protein AB0M35_20750 [Micromonospora sp. NPDC051196]|uniref:hypothetical protein n=1 Tax=Micromonospora sp. NPDC051196 TaxID=3155281 RepID=UPI0034435023
MALDLTGDLEVLSFLADDLASRIPEAQPMASALARLPREGAVIVADMRGPHQQRVGIRTHRRVGSLVETLAREREGMLLLVEGAVWSQQDHRARANCLIRNLHLAHGRADRLHVSLTGWQESDAGLGINLHLDRDLAGDLTEDSEPGGAEEVQAGIALQPGRQALRLVDLIVRVLPPDQRARYGEEFRAELYGLVEMKRWYGAQLFYVLRQFNRVFELRSELRRPSPRRLVP